MIDMICRMSALLLTLQVPQYRKTRRVMADQFGASALSVDRLVFRREYIMSWEREREGDKKEK